jgi:hypothetical protein
MIVRRVSFLMLLAAAGFLTVALFMMSCGSEENPREALDRDLPRFKSLAYYSPEKPTSVPKGKVLVLEVEHQFERKSLPDRINHFAMSLLPERIRPNSPEEVKTIARVQYSYTSVGAYTGPGGGCIAYRTRANILLIDITNNAFIAEETIERDPPEHPSQSLNCAADLTREIAAYLTSMDWRE